MDTFAIEHAPPFGAHAWSEIEHDIRFKAEAPDVVPHPRRDSLLRRLKQIERYRLTKSG